MDETARIAPRSWIDGFWGRGLLEPPAQGPVAFGGPLLAADLLAAHTNGLLPMPCDTAEDAEVNELLYADGVRGGDIRLAGDRGPSYDLAWWSPDPRPVLTARSLRIGSGLSRTLRAARHWTTTVDRAFERVVHACRAGRDPRWLTDRLVAALCELHHTGWYHSLEVWSGNRLVGGAIGMGRGAVFSADTMFHLEGGASRIALVDLLERLADTPAHVLDLQRETPHGHRLGAQLMTRREYVALAALSIERIALPAEERTVDRLLDLPAWGRIPMAKGVGT